MWYYNGAPSPILDTDIGIQADIIGGSSGSYPKEFFVYNDKLYFSATNGINGEELWLYDGVNFPAMIADVNTGGDSFPKELTGYGPMLLFAATRGDIGTELFAYMDSDKQFFEIADINGGPANSDPKDLTIFISVWHLCG